MSKGGGSTRRSTSSNPNGVGYTASGSLVGASLSTVRSIIASSKDRDLSPEAKAIKEIDRAPFKKTDFGYAMETKYGSIYILDSVDLMGNRIWEVQNIAGPEDKNRNVENVSIGAEFVSLETAKANARNELILRFYLREQTNEQTSRRGYGRW